MLTIDLRGQGYRDQVFGCWLGKNCGGTLGAPLETLWGQPEPFDVWWYPELKEGGIPNDDLEMQLIWLKALEEVGPGLKAADLAQYWLDHIVYNWDEYGLSKANLRLGLLPPVSGAYNNWFKDCMGCPIRSEIWACVAPGAPRVATRYAFEDAICDHAGGESVYGELFNTAVESAAFVVSDREQLIDIGLSYIDPASKTAQAIHAARAAHAAGLDWKAARRCVLEATPHYNAQYSPINLGFQVLGWLYGEDFGDALCKTVNCGYDTDCTGATVGSILGIIATRHGLPARWTEPLGVSIATNESWGGLRAVSTGPNPVPATLDELTDRVVVMAQRVLAAHGLLQDGAVVNVEPQDLYADASVRDLWHAPVMRIAYRTGATTTTITTTIDYGDTPAIAPAATKTITANIANPQSALLLLRCIVQAPVGWQVATNTIDLVVPAGAEKSISWQITAPGPDRLENTNTLYVCTTSLERPALPATPIVLIGARRLRLAGPYALATLDERAAYDHPYPPEAGDGSGPAGRPGDWQTTSTLDNALPITAPLAGGGVLYLQTFVWSPNSRTDVVGIPGNCPRKLWVNGTATLCCFSHGPLRPNYHGDGESYAEVQLRPGWNELLVKYVRLPGAAPAEGHLVVTTADVLRHGLVDLGWTRLPWEAGAGSLGA